MAVKKAATRSQEFSDSVIDTVREPLIILDQDLRVVTASRSFYEFFKVKPDETEGQLIYNLGNDQWDIPKLRELLETILPQKTTFDNYEVEHDFATIGKRIMLLNARQIKRALGKERIILLAIEDITERKRMDEDLRRSEETFRLAMDATDDALWDWNIVTNEVYRNPRHAEMLGYVQQDFSSSQEEWETLIHPDDKQRVFDCTEAHLKGETPFVAIQYRLKKKSGDYLWVLGRGKVVAYNDDGKPIRIIGTNIDITERKQAEEELRESEIRYRELFDNISSGVAIYEVTNNGNDFIFKDFNRAGERLDGDLKEDIIGKSIYQVRPGINEYGLLEVFKRVWATGISEHYPVKFYQDERLKGWYDNFVYRLPSGEIVAVYDDITERKQAEEELHIALEKYRVLFETFPLGISITDSAGHIIEANRESERLLGISRDEHTSRNYVGPEWHIVRPDGTPMPVDEYASVRAMKENCLIKNVEMGIVKEDLEIIWINVAATPIPLENFGVAITYGDITERKRTEEALRESEGLLRGLFENMTAGAAIYEVINDGSKGSDYIIRDFNVTSLRIEGKRKDEVIGKSLFDLRPNINQYGLIPIFQKVWRTGEPGYFPSTIYIDGKYSNWYENRVFKLPTGEIVAIYNEVTERKQAEEELRTSHSQLRALYKRLQQIREEERIRIAREIHDEMGGGLTGLKMDLSWLSRKIGAADLGEERVALIDRIKRSNVLIDQMIHVVRRVSTDLRPSILDDLGLVAALEWQLSEFTRRTEILHEFATASENVNMEKDTAIAVFRVFQEALTNVARHSRATKVVVFLREGERDLFGAESFVLEIRDNGRGITQEEILNPESLGLLGMKERVLLFGGELSIRAESGGGTAVILQIPRKQGEAS